MSRRTISLEDFRQEARDRFQLVLGDKETEIRPLSVADICNMNFPDNPFQLENVFRPGELIIIVGARKTSKSYFLMDIIITLASGGKISDRIFSRKMHEVALIDTELSLRDLAARIPRVGNEHKDAKNWGKSFIVVCLKEEGRQIDLSNEKDQQWIEKKIGSAKVVAFDNYGKSIKPGFESCAKTWRRVTAWFERLQQKGITVILVHHENKAGETRGTLKMEDDADLVISLKRPEKWVPANGNIVIVNFPAARHLHGDQVKSFTIEYSEDENGFHRTVKANGIDQSASEEIQLRVSLEEPAVSPEEMKEFSLSDLQAEILRIARTRGRVKACDVINADILGRKSSTVSEAFRDLCGKGLLKAVGENSGRFYTPVSK